MTDRVRDKFEQHHNYKMVQWKKTVEFDILNDISDHVTLVQLIDTDGNVHHSVNINRCSLYKYNDKRALTLIKKSLDIMYSTYKNEKGIYAEFKSVYYASRYVNPKAKYANTDKLETFWIVVLSKILYMCVYINIVFPLKIEKYNNIRT